jgi:hypothetical protein
MDNDCDPLEASFPLFDCTAASTQQADRYIQKEITECALFVAP